MGEKSYGHFCQTVIKNYLVTISTSALKMPFALDVEKAKLEVKKDVMHFETTTLLLPYYCQVLCCFLSAADI